MYDSMKWYLSLNLDCKLDADMRIADLMEHEGLSEQEAIEKAYMNYYTVLIVYKDIE